ncbi:phosphotransferase family protein [Pseudonocardia spinosispora]|uniref:phosphotransferase family protein n=1 Tax=Pseudonocardia spinosispora TaxID=103441 RepID=UPI00041738EA|nr:phosphotransferase [Pseudonocardia spinosispora]
MNLTAIPLLETTSEIGAGWLSAVLDRTYPGARVRSAALRPIGAGNVSDTVHISLDYADRPPGAPDAVVAKFRPRSPEVHEHGVGSGAYHREIGGYRAITERAACRIPRLFHVDGDETNINLVVEDLTAATPGDQVAGCGTDEARAVLTQLARLHACFSPMDPATAPTWPIRMTEAADYWTPMIQRGAAIAVERYSARLSRTDLHSVAAAGELAQAWHLLPQARLSLTHGDPRVDNVLFEPADGGCQAVLIDWQVTGLRNPMYDVGYFLSGSLSVDDRRAHERELLDHYLGEFTARGASYTSGEAIDDYRTQVMSGLMITTAAIAVLPDVDQVNTLLLALLERNCAAVADWDAVEATRLRAHDPR